MPPSCRSATARAFTSAVHFRMHTPTTLRPWQVPSGFVMAGTFPAIYRPIPKIIISWAIQNWFTRSSAASSSLFLSHFSDFGRGRFCRDVRKKEIRWREFSRFKNNQCRLISGQWFFQTKFWIIQKLSSQKFQPSLATEESFSFFDVHSIKGKRFILKRKETYSKRTETYLWKKRYLFLKGKKLTLKRKEI